MSPLRAGYLLTHNIKALIRARGVTAADLAFFCRHKPAWASKVLANQRGISLDDIDCIADFFGVTVDQLFRPGIAAVLERRQQDRRVGPRDRRQSERRQGVPRPPSQH